MNVQSFGARLFTAIRENNINAVTRLVSDRPELLRASDFRGSTPLVLATYLGQAEIAEALLAAGADPDITDKSGNTPLMGVSFKGYTELVDLLLRHGADVNRTGANGATALHLAVMFHQPAVVRQLVEAGADAGARDGEGMTVRERAETMGLGDLLELLR